MTAKKYSSFSKINKILPQTARQYHLENTFQKHTVIHYWEEALQAFVSKADGLTKALDFRNGTLYVACLSEMVAQEIRRLAERIVYALNQLVGKNLVYAIEVEC